MIIHEHLETTDARAKELRGVVDRLVTLGKKGTLHARRQAFKYLNNHQLVQKLFDEIAPRFSERQGGYTRLIKSRIRFVDQAPMTFVRFSSEDLQTSTPKEEPTETTATTTVEAQVKAGVEEELETAQAETETEVETAEADEVAVATEGGETAEVEAASPAEDSESEEKAEK
jgi:large subunit ribosomal protein L17